MVDQEVNDDVACACFQQDRHLAEYDASMFVRHALLMDTSNCQSLPLARATDEVERVGWKRQRRWSLAIRNLAAYRDFDVTAN